MTRLFRKTDVEISYFIIIDKKNNDFRFAGRKTIFILQNACRTYCCDSSCQSKYNDV